MAESLTLKWGTLKAWTLKNVRTKALFDRYVKLGVSYSAAMQHDTPEQKKIICKLIDAIDCEVIYLDWEGKHVTKDEAKKYVLEYGKIISGA